MLRTLALGLAFVLRRGGADDAASVAAAAVRLGLPAMSVGFLLGLLRWRIYTADSPAAARRAGFAIEAGPERRRDLIADTLSDPTVELAYWRGENGGAWRDADGAPISLPRSRRATVTPP